MLSYYQNININTAEMTLEDELERTVIASTGKGHDYQNHLKVALEKERSYRLCFQKEQSSSEALDVHFDIVNIEDLEMEMPAGKEDINKVVFRVGEFLVEIKKTSGEYREVLSQHNVRIAKLKDYEARNMYIYMAKLSLMAVILMVQVVAVRKIFD